MRRSGVSRSLHVAGGSVQAASMDADDARIAGGKFEAGTRL
jgi:hypothetical protein